ncbi:MAG: hypothetical protein AB1410_05045 [Acidobacteriota bacterium]
MKVFKKFLFIAAFLLIITAFSSAGWKIQQVSYIEGEEEKTTETFLISQGKIKFLSEDYVQIIDSEKQLIFFLNPEKELYYGGTIDEFKKEWQEYLNELKKEMEEYKAQFEKYLREQKTATSKKIQEKPQMKPKVDIKSTNEMASIAGFRTLKFQVFEDGNLKEEVWIAPDTGIEKEFSMQKFFELIVKVFSSIAKTFTTEEIPLYDETDEYLNLLSKGFPFRTITYYDTSKQIEEITKAEKLNIPDSEFLPPPGYKKVTLKEAIKLESEDIEF